MKSNIRDIGKALIEQGENKPSSARGMVDELFPYIYAVHKRMSARAISRWLEEEQQLKLSYTTISKVLKEADSRMEQLVGKIRELENQLYRIPPLPSLSADGREIEPTLLFDRLRFENKVEECRSLYLSNELNEFGLSEQEFKRTANSIRHDWFELPEAFRNACKRFA